MSENTPPKPRTPRRKKAIRLTIFGLAWFGLILLVMYNAFYVYYLTRRAPSEICCVTPADWGFKYEDVTLRSRDGVKIAGWYIPGQNGAAIILLHGFGGNRLGMDFQAQFLAKAGYGVLMVDLRGHGQSGGKYRDWGWHDDWDVAAEVAFLQQQPGVQHVGIEGFSYGSVIALASASKIKSIEAVVADAPDMLTAGDVRAIVKSPDTLKIYINTRLSDLMSTVYLGIPIPSPVVQDMPRLAGRPVLLIGGGSEYLEVDYIKSYYKAAREPKSIWIIPEATHGQTWVKRPQEYTQRVTAFFDAALLGK